jgi:hypothetical protein
MEVLWDYLHGLNGEIWFTHEVGGLHSQMIWLGWTGTCSKQAIQHDGYIV